MNALTFECDMPPTSNNAYLNVRGRGRVLSSEARTFKEAAAWSAYKARKAQGWPYAPDTKLQLAIRFHFAVNAVKRKRDIGNREKLLTDAIAQALGFDDSVIDRIVLERGAKAEREHCIVRLEPYQAN